MAAENGDIPIGGAVAVFALGSVGLMSIAGAKLRGAGLIIGVDSIAKRGDLAKSFGADVIVDFSKQDPVARIMELTGGRGVDCAIEALGSEVSFQNAMKVTKPGGTVSSVGYHGKGDLVGIPRLDWGVGMAEKSIRTGLCPGGRLRMERMLLLLQNKRVDPTSMTTHTYPFARLDEAFNVMDQKLDGVIKPLITF
jgi:threonine dehydrogenase-like Zn-dependent dehydrogenase